MHTCALAGAMDVDSSDPDPPPLPAAGAGTSQWSHSGPTSTRVNQYAVTIESGPPRHCSFLFRFPIEFFTLCSHTHKSELPLPAFHCYWKSEPLNFALSGRSDRTLQGDPSRPHVLFVSPKNADNLEVEATRTLRRYTVSCIAASCFAVAAASPTLSNATFKFQAIGRLGASLLRASMSEPFLWESMTTDIHCGLSESVGGRPETSSSQ